jgi:hypothetical protein
LLKASTILHFIMGNKTNNTTLFAKVSDPEGQLISDGKLGGAKYRRKIPQSSSPELDPRQADLRARWQLQRWEAAVWRDSQLRTVARTYEREMEKLSREAEERNESLRVALLTKRLKRLRSLAGPGALFDKPESELVPIVSVAPEPLPEVTGPGGRTLRNKQKSQNSDSQSSAPVSGIMPISCPTGVPPARRKNLPFFDTTLQRLGVSITLPDSEISTDISQISKQRSAITSGNDISLQTSKKAVVGITRASARNVPSLVKGPSSVVECSVDARITEIGTLVYEGHEFVTGDTVTLEINGSRFSGTLSSVQSAEIWIRRDDDGTKNKIYLGQLRVGRNRLVI